jgi:hypothetical protein
VAQTIQIDHVPCPFAGSGIYFICPVRAWCGGRVSKPYSRGSLFLFAYGSENQHEIARAQRPPARSGSTSVVRLTWLVGSRTGPTACGRGPMSASVAATVSPSGELRTRSSTARRGSGRRARKHTNHQCRMLCIDPLRAPNGARGSARGAGSQSAAASTCPHRCGAVLRSQGAVAGPCGAIGTINSRVGLWRGLGRMDGPSRRGDVPRGRAARNSVGNRFDEDHLAEPGDA